MADDKEKNNLTMAQQLGTSFAINPGSIGPIYGVYTGSTRHMAASTPVQPCLYLVISTNLSPKFKVNSDLQVLTSA